MEKEYAVFWLFTERKIYFDDSFYVLGELMGAFKTKEEAEEKIKSFKTENMCTILEIYTSKKEIL